MFAPNLAKFFIINAVCAIVMVPFVSSYHTIAFILALWLHLILVVFICLIVRFKILQLLKIIQHFACSEII